MKVGDYVRTECGIAKIKSFETKNKELIELDKDIMICNMDCYRNNCTINQVIKSSPNIIDLIEVGDYVNGEEVKEKFNYLLGFECGQDGEYYRDEKDIKSIITKEQFSQIKYRIG